MVLWWHALFSVSKRYRTPLVLLLPSSFTPPTPTPFPPCLAYLVEQSAPMKGMEACSLCLLVW